MNTYSASDGTRYTIKQRNRLMTVAKQEKIDEQLISDGYTHCERCQRSSGTYFDCAHIISVKEASESGNVELCWDKANIVIMCRECHQEYDGLNLKV